ncbi:transporter substrate-binding domain-containing protein [Polaromonas sp. P1(28)-8]|nr:transporter substrate-binding domain-containing protein [Polaromonas sp. P1(28)-8]
MAVSYNTFVTGVKVLVPATSAAESIKDLSGKKMAVASGSSTVALLKQLDAIHNLSMKILEVDSQKKAFEMVKTRQVDAMISEEPILAALNAGPDAQKQRIIGPHLSIEPYAILMRKGDVSFERSVDKALADAFSRKDSERLYKKWFNNSEIFIPLDKHVRECYAFPGKYGI